MLVTLENFNQIVFTKVNIASKSGPIRIRTKKNKPFPDYSENYSFQGGGQLEYSHEVHKARKKI